MDVTQLSINCEQAAEGLRQFAEAANRFTRAFSEIAEAFNRVTAFANPFADEVNERARLLLLAHLSPEQRRTFEAKRYFIVQGKLHRWRVTPEFYGVHRLGRSGRCRGVYCAVPKECVPLYDVLLAQKLMLETNETGFLAVANHAPNYRALSYD